MNRSISPGLSIYLDLVRFLAALSVVLYHTWMTLFPSSHVKWPGHEAVVVFFVLSGFVIAHAATRPGVDLRTYVQHRAARILPVAFLALLLGGLITVYAGPALPPDTESTSGHSLVSAVMLNLLFIAQSGALFMLAPLNTPYWSLNYEVWYYLLFAAWLFSPARWRLPWTILAALLAGPKILLLFPIWLMGVWLYHRMPCLTPRMAWIVFAITLAAGAAGTWLNVSDLLRSWLYAVFPPAWHLHFSTQFLYDLPLGMVVTAHFAAVSSLAPTFRTLFVFEKPIRFLAGFTFSAYVFHGPLTVLIHDVCGVHATLPFFLLLAVGIFVLAQLTERRTGFYRRLLCVGRASVPLRE